jgi:hypothetical protein
MKRTTFGCLFLEDTRHAEGRKRQKEGKENGKERREADTTEMFAEGVQIFGTNDSKQRTLMK